MKKSIYNNELQFFFIISVHGKNSFTEISKNLAICKSENNFVRPLKLLYRTFKH